MKKRLMIALTLICVCFTIMPHSTYANTIVEPVVSSETVITTRAEVTEYYYKEIRGVLHKRLWSVTYGYWIDPVWYPV